VPRSKDPDSRFRPVRGFLTECTSCSAFFPSPHQRPFLLFPGLCTGSVVVSGPSPQPVLFSPWLFSITGFDFLAFSVMPGCASFPARPPACLNCPDSICVHFLTSALLFFLPVKSIGCQRSSYLTAFAACSFYRVCAFGVYIRSAELFFRPLSFSCGLVPDEGQGLSLPPCFR